MTKTEGPQPNGRGLFMCVDKTPSQMPCVAFVYATDVLVPVRGVNPVRGSERLFWAFLTVFCFAALVDDGILGILDSWKNFLLWLIICQFGIRVSLSPIQAFG